MNFNGKRTDKIRFGITFREILDAIPYYVLLVDSEHNILFANKATGKTFNKDPGELVGGYCPEILHGKAGPIDGCPLEISVKTKKLAEKEIYDSENKRWYLSVIYPTGIKTDKDKEIYFHQIRDITAKKNAEAQVRKQKKELTNKNIALKELLYSISAEKKELEKRTIDTLEKLIGPKLKTLYQRSSKKDKKLIALLMRDTRALASNFGKTILRRELGLSRREIEICDLIKNGYQNKEIAEELLVSVKTVETVRKTIRKKFKIRNRKINLQNLLQNLPE